MRRHFRTIAFTLALLVGLYGASSAQMRIDGGVPAVISGAKTFTGVVTFGSDIVMSSGGSAISNGGGTVNISTGLTVTGGNTNILGTGSLNFSTRSGLKSPSDGVLTIWNSAETDFSRLQFGGTTSSFPALKRSGTTLQVRLGDDSAAGGLGFATLAISGTAPTIASGGCTSPAVTSSNGTAAFLITIGTSCTGVKTVTLTMPAASNFWACQGHNNTSDAAQQTNVIAARATGTTAVVLTSYDRVTGLQEDFTASDTYLLQCFGE